jgi:hypothetical protein
MSYFVAVIETVFWWDVFAIALSFTRERDMPLKYRHNFAAFTAN